jgi:tetratricopeptide (TPR) repeat protein
VLEKALSAADWVRQKAPLEEILKVLRPLRLRSIEQLDPNTRGRLLTTLLRVQRQKPPPPAAPAAQPAAAEPSAPTASEPVPTAEAESATPAAVQPEPVDSARAEPSATPAPEQAAEAGATGEPEPPIQEAAPAAKPSAEKDEKVAAYSDVMFLVGSVWRALGDESRAAFALAASGRPEEQREAVKALHRSGDWRDEAQMLESQNRLREAARVHERHQSHAEAARLFEAGGDLKSALRSLLEAKDQAGGRRLLKQIDAEQARPILESARSYELLMERYVEAGDFENVAKLYERARQYDQAGMAWERAGKLAQARKAFARAKDLGNAQRLRQLEVEKLLQRGDRLGAALLLLGDGQREQAAQTLLALPPPKAFRFLQKVKLDQEALELARREIARAEAENKPASRARWLELLGDFSSAAEAWQSAERRDKALALYEQAGDWQRAAEMAEAIGQKDRAVELYHRAGDKVSAERLSSLTETEAAPSAPTSPVPLEGQGEER